VLEIGLERLRILLLVKVSLRPAPRADGAHHAADQLADAALALGRAECAAEVLRGDHVGRGLRPELRDFDVLLLEDDLALLVGDDRAALLPFDLVEGVDARTGEGALDGQTLGRLSEGQGSRESGGRRRTPGLLLWLRGDPAIPDLRLLLHSAPSETRPGVRPDPPEKEMT
jgi:hypothetical protein